MTGGMKYVDVSRCPGTKVKKMERSTRMEEHELFAFHALHFPIIQPSRSTRMVEQKSVEMKISQGTLTQLLVDGHKGIAEPSFSWLLQMHVVQKIIWVVRKCHGERLLVCRKWVVIAEMSMKYASCAELKWRMDSEDDSRWMRIDLYVSPSPIPTHSSPRRLSKTYSRRH